MRSYKAAEAGSNGIIKVGWKKQLKKCTFHVLHLFGYASMFTLRSLHLHSSPSKRCQLGFIDSFRDSIPRAKVDRACYEQHDVRFTIERGVAP